MQSSPCWCSLHSPSPLARPATGSFEISGPTAKGQGMWSPTQPPSSLPHRHGGRRSARPVALCWETVSNPLTRSAPQVGMRSLACDSPCLPRCIRRSCVPHLAMGLDLAAHRGPLPRGVQEPFVTVSCDGPSHNCPDFAARARGGSGVGSHGKPEGWVLIGGWAMLAAGGGRAGVEIAEHAAVAAYAPG
jgi:hypothetical protein